MVTRSLIASLLFLASSGAFACADAENMMPLQSDDAGAPEAFIRFDPPPLSAPFNINLLICDENFDVVEVDAQMPTHKHGMNYEPTITQTSIQNFEVSGMVFHMPGLWQIELLVGNEDITLRYWRDVEVK